eukprot:1007059_1
MRDIFCMLTAAISAIAAIIMAANVDTSTYSFAVTIRPRNPSTGLPIDDHGTPYMKVIELDIKNQPFAKLKKEITPFIHQSSESLSERRNYTVYAYAQNDIPPFGKFNIYMVNDSDIVNNIRLIPVVGADNPFLPNCKLLNVYWFNKNKRVCPAATASRPPQQRRRLANSNQNQNIVANADDNEDVDLAIDDDRVVNGISMDNNHNFSLEMNSNNANANANEVMDDVSMSDIPVRNENDNNNRSQTAPP